MVLRYVESNISTFHYHRLNDDVIRLFDRAYRMLLDKYSSIDGSLASQELNKHKRCRGQMSTSHVR